MTSKIQEKLFLSKYPLVLFKYTFQSRKKNYKMSEFTFLLWYIHISSVFGIWSKMTLTTFKLKEKKKKP